MCLPLPVKSYPFQLDSELCCLDLIWHQCTDAGCQVVLVVKNLPANARDIRDKGLIPWSGGSPVEGDGNAVHYSCLESPIARGAWQATVHRTAKSWTQSKLACTHACTWLDHKEG